TRDQRRPLVDHRVEELARLVVAGAVGPNHLAAQRLLERGRAASVEGRRSLLRCRHLSLPFGSSDLVSRRRLALRAPAHHAVGHTANVQKCMLGLGSALMSVKRSVAAWPADDPAIGFLGTLEPGA